MDDLDLEHLKALRALGVKSIDIRKDGSHYVEFFETPAPPQFGSIDIDTILPPVDNGDTERPPAPAKLAPALSRVLKRGSVS